MKEPWKLKNKFPRPIRLGKEAGKSHSDPDEVKVEDRSQKDPCSSHNCEGKVSAKPHRELNKYSTHSHTLV